MSRITEAFVAQFEEPYRDNIGSMIQGTYLYIVVEKMTNIFIARDQKSWSQCMELIRAARTTKKKNIYMHIPAGADEEGAQHDPQ